MTPMKSVVKSPYKGTYQIGSMVILTVKRFNLVQMNLANEAVEMRKVGVKPYTKKHFHHLFEQEVEKNFKTEEGKAAGHTYWQSMT